MADTSTRSRTMAMVEAAAELGFELLQGDAAAEGLTLAARLMGCDVVSRPALDAVVARQPAAALGLRQDGRLTGVVATLLLGPDLHRALAAGDFDGRGDLAERICAAEDVPTAYYIWGVVGDTRRARWAAMELCQRLRFETLPDLAAFTRAATADGRRAAIARLGFQPLRHTEDNLLVSPPAILRTDGERLAA